VKINKERGNYKDENATDMLDIDTIELLAFIGLLFYAAVFKSCEYKIIICFRQHRKGYLLLHHE
jgi:hypothetical protein